MMRIKSKQYSVLIVDDDNLTIMMLTSILGADYDVFAAKTAKNAVSAAEKYMPTVILLDVLMPGDVMDGHAILGSLKENEKTKDIPIILVTGLDKPEDETKGMALGAADYIIKPFSHATVKLRVQNQIKMLEQAKTIERLTVIDQLTSLPNRLSFEGRLASEWKSSAEQHKHVSLLMINVDNLKLFNKTHGYHEGDSVLKSLADVFLEAVQPHGGFAARWESSKFAILLPSINMQKAARFAENLRKKILFMEIQCAHQVEGQPPIKITLSMGVSSAENIQIEKPEVMTDEELAVHAANAPANAAGSAPTAAPETDADKEAIDALISVAVMALTAARSKGGNKVFCLTKKGSH